MKQIEEYLRKIKTIDDTIAEVTEWIGNAYVNISEYDDGVKMPFNALSTLIAIAIEYRNQMVETKVEEVH